MGLEAGSYVYLWTALSLTIVPLLAMLVHWSARQRGAVPGLLMAGVAAGVIADGAIRQMWLHYVLDALPPEFPLHPVQAVANVAFALIIAAILPRYTETRLWALALAVPLSLPAHVVIDRAYGGLLT